MKHLKIAVMALFTFGMVANVNAQDSNNPWAVSFGFNSVDFRGGRSLENLAKDYLGTSDWNVLPSVSRISVEKYLKNGFTLQVAGSLNKIETFRAKDDSGEMYSAFDVNVKYDVNKMVDMVFGSTTPYFDPYVYLGVGYTSFGDNGEAMLNAGAGFNVWFSESLGLNVQSGAKRNFTGKVADHFQHSLGLVLRFGGTGADGDGVSDK